MSKLGKSDHEKMLSDVIKSLSTEDNRFVKLGRKCPDAVGIINGKLVAIDVMGRQEIRTGKALALSWHSRDKKQLYKNMGFDDVLIYEFTY